MNITCIIFIIIIHSLLLCHVTKTHFQIYRGNISSKTVIQPNFCNNIDNCNLPNPPSLGTNSVFNNEWNFVAIKNPYPNPTSSEKRQGNDNASDLQFIPFANLQSHFQAIARKYLRIYNDMNTRVSHLENEHFPQNMKKGEKGNKGIAGTDSHHGDQGDQGNIGAEQCRRGNNNVCMYKDHHYNSGNSYYKIKAGGARYQEPTRFLSLSTQDAYIEVSDESRGHHNSLRCTSQNTSQCRFKLV